LVLINLLATGFSEKHLTASRGQYGGWLCNFITQTTPREIAQPYRFWGLLGFPPRNGGSAPSLILHFGSNEKIISRFINLPEYVEPLANSRVGMLL